MSPEEREKMNELCNRIKVEKNPEIFDQLVQDLNDLLEIKHGHPTRAQEEINRAVNLIASKLT